jgi:hypothetical protein
VDGDLLSGFGLRGFVGSFDELAIDEHRVGADERAKPQQKEPEYPARMPTGATSPGSISASSARRNLPLVAIDRSAPLDP